MGCLISGRTRYPQKIIDQAKALWDQKVPPHKIAAQLGISGDIVVRRWFDEAYRLRHNEKSKLRARGEYRSTT